MTKQIQIRNNVFDLLATMKSNTKPWSDYLQELFEDNIRLIKENAELKKVK